MTVVVRRSAVKMWLMALGGIPLLVLSLDVLTNRRITNYLRVLLFRPENTQIFEPRDVIWSWALLLFSVFVIVWGLKELFAPTKVIECRPEGLAVRLRGPVRRATVIPWERVNDVIGITVDDEGRKLPMLGIDVLSAGELPSNPWGARWIEENRLAILGEDWADTPQQVAKEISDYAVERVRIAQREAVASIWKPAGSGMGVGSAPRHLAIEREDGAEEEE